MIRFLILVCASFTLSSCGWIKAWVTDLDPVTGPMVEFTYSTPSADPRCSCSGSRGAYLSSLDAKNSRTVTWRQTETDTGSGAVSTTIDQTVIAPKESKFIDCTLGKKDTPGLCNLKTDFRLQSASALLSVTEESPASLIAMGAYYSPTIQSCAIICEPLGDQTCFRFGKGAAPAFLPLIALSEGLDADVGVIKKDDVARAYGLDPSKDKCERGDIVVSKDHVTNISSKARGYCNAEIYQLGADRTVPNVSIFTPQRLRARRTSSQDYPMVSESVSAALEFEFADEAPRVGFLRPDPDGTEYLLDEEATSLWGGSVQAAARTNDDRLIVATSNGCLSVNIGG